MGGRENGNPSQRKKKQYSELLGLCDDDEAYCTEGQGVSTQPGRLDESGIYLKNSIRRAEASGLFDAMINRKGFLELIGC